MKDTLIVFRGIVILLLLPLLFYGGKCIIRSKKEKDFKYLYLRLAFVGLVCAGLIALFYNIYNFTLSYQAPLVAEDYLLKEGFEHLEDVGLNPQEYKIYLSENIYENEDGSITIYSRFQSENSELYTIIYLKREGDSWGVSEHEIITEGYENYPEIKKRFYPIDS